MKKYFLILAFLFLPFIMFGTTYSSTRQLNFYTTFTKSSSYLTMNVVIADDSKEGLRTEPSGKDGVRVTAIKRGTWQFSVEKQKKDYTWDVDNYIWKVVEVVNVDIPSAVSMTCGEKFVFNPIITDAEAETSLQWFSSDSDVATVDNGTVTACKVGNTTITVTATNGVKSSCLVSVKPILVRSINIEQVPDMRVGEQLSLQYTVIPENATNKAVKFESSRPDIVDVSPIGELTALQSGTAYITIDSKENSNVSNFVKVVVIAAEPKLNEIKINNGDMGLLSVFVPDGSDLKLNYKPCSPIWAIEMVTHNGIEIESNSNEENIYEICGINEPGEILVETSPKTEIGFELTTDEAPIVLDNRTYAINNGILQISGLEMDDIVELYLMNGFKVVSQTIDTDRNMKITLQPGFYILCVNGVALMKVKL